MWQFDLTPKPPYWNFDWRAIEDSLPWLKPLADCPQDPEWHAEGNVLIHTRMVAEELVQLDEWRNLPEATRDCLFIAALLHDIAKPQTTREEEGRIVAPKHTVIGQRVARRILWEAKEFKPLAIMEREFICGLVRYHGLPLNFLKRQNVNKAVYHAAHLAPNELTALLAEADVRGRTTAGKQALLDEVSLFREYCAEKNVLRFPPPFESNHHRFHFFRAEQELYVPYDDTRLEVTLLSGIPASGKDHWIRNNVHHDRVISLDDLRVELDVDPAGNQGKVGSEAHARAVVFLRAKQDFVFNATNITRQMRDRWVNWFANYKARVKIVYAEAPIEDLFRRNRARKEPVPQSVMNRMIEKLEVPDVTECHSFEVALP